MSSRSSSRRSWRVSGPRRERRTLKYRLIPRPDSCFTWTGAEPQPKGHAVQALPDLGTLSDAELKQLIDDLIQEENEVSYRRRILHGKIDILRAERTARLQRSIGEGRNPLEDVDVEKLTAILTGKSVPPPGDAAA